jgi:hypothetical protein
MALTKVNSTLVDGTINTTAAGNVGIGTTTPNANSGTSLVVYDASTPRIRLTNSTTGQAAGDGSELTIFGSDFYIENREAANIIFYNNGAERMRIDSSGNLLVGTTSTFTGGGVNDGKGGVYVATDVAQAIPLSLKLAGGNGTVASFIRGGQTSPVGSISITTTATSYNTSSDYRLKENIAPMTGALAVVGQLKPCTYTWKEDGSAGQGFIAHELQAVVPDCVTGEKDAVDADGNPIHQGIDTSFLVATLTAAIQEQQAIITDLKARIETLEAK